MTGSRSRPRRPDSRRRDQRGTALIEVTWLSVLLLVPLVYLVLAVFDVQRSAFGVTGAARAAGRAYSLAPEESVAMARARAAAAVALRDQHLDLADGSLTVSCHPVPGNCLSPGATIDVRLRMQVPLPLVPTALGGSAPTVRVEASHSVAYGTFREDR